MAEENQLTLEKIVSLAKRRGFIFPGSDIYGGLANTWDYGPLGAELKKNVKDAWWKRFVRQRGDMHGIDTPILMNTKVWQASGHIENFTDPLVEDKVTHKRYRADHLLEANKVDPTGLSLADMQQVIQEKKIKSPDGNELTEPQTFNLMFKTFVGPLEDKANTVYLRPETAQGMFVDFKNILDTTRARVPFGIAQIGRNFRNEITAGNFTFRQVEFEIAEFEYFVKPGDDEAAFEEWQQEQMAFCLDLGLKKENLRFYEHPKESLSHYSKRTVDIEYKFPFGWGEITGLANRTDYDLKRHMEHSGKDLSYRDPVTNETYVPYVIEPTFGVDRLVLAVLCDAYTEIEGGRSTTTEATKEVETVMRFNYRLAPYQVAVLPLSKKDELSSIAKDLAEKLRDHFVVTYDETASIGRRYRRQDEIGTPLCVTVDFDSLEDRAVTIRDRDSMEQQRISMADLAGEIAQRLADLPSQQV